MARGDEEEIIAGLFEEELALRGRGVVQRLDALDAERFDDGVH